MRPDLKRYDAFLLDVDGVLVRERQPIPGAADALAALRRLGCVLLLSNNSTLSQQGYVNKLNDLGFAVSEAEILNSAMLAAEYVSERAAAAPMFVVGAAGLREELARRGHRLDADHPGWLVSGLDPALTYDTLNRGLQALRAGARWVATGADATFPTPDGARPGAGAIVGAFRGMGFEPEAVVGKPSPFCMAHALQRAGASDPRRVLVIGDRIETDILGARELGADSALVLSGVTSAAVLAESACQPTWTATDLTALVGSNR